MIRVKDAGYAVDQTWYLDWHAMGMVLASHPARLTLTNKVKDDPLAPVHA